jgi:hypothetical protein
MVTENAEAKQWIIYFCYCKEDESCIQWLYERLRNLGITVWSEQDRLLVGDAILWQKEEGLKGSMFLLLAVSQHAIASGWMKAELELMLNQMLNQQSEKLGPLILPIALDDTEPGAISSYLQGKHYVRIPCDGSEEQFAKLLESLKEHLSRHGLSELAASLDKPQQYPYGLVNGIHASHFVVPELVVKEISEHLSKGISVSLVGVPMMGKTSLLNFLGSRYYIEYYRRFRLISLNIKPLFFDIQEYVGCNRDELMLELGKAISKITKMQFVEEEYEKVLNWIKLAIGRRTQEGPLFVLLIDDFDNIVDIEGIDKRFFDDLRMLTQNYRLCYIIASRQKLNELSLPRAVKASPFFHSFKSHVLTIWDTPTAESLVFKPYGKKTELFSEADFAWIVHLTARHPFLLQLACERLLKTSSMGGKNIKDQALQDFMENAENTFYIRYWDYEIDTGERKWLMKYWQNQYLRGEEAEEEIQGLTLGQKNQRIVEKLAKLGLLLNDSKPPELPRGFDLFLKKKLMKA